MSLQTEKLFPTSPTVHHMSIYVCDASNKLVYQANYKDAAHDDVGLRVLQTLFVIGKYQDRYDMGNSVAHVLGTREVVAYVEGYKDYFMVREVSDAVKFSEVESVVSIELPHVPFITYDDIQREARTT